jgi:hypothetical protein
LFSRLDSIANPIRLAASGATGPRSTPILRRQSHSLPLVDAFPPKGFSKDGTSPELGKLHLSTRSQSRRAFPCETSTFFGPAFRLFRTAPP